MNKDFETHALGTANEIRLSRALMTALDDMPSHKDLSEDVKKAFLELYNYYQYQMEMGTS